MLTLLEKYMPVTGAFLFTLITVLGVLAWLKHRRVFLLWKEEVSREATGLSTKAIYLLESLDGELQASMITATLRILTQLSPIAALALTGFTYRNLQLSQLKASQLTLSDVFSAMQPVYLPMSVLACVTAYSMLVTGVLRTQVDRILSRARRETALWRSPFEQPLEQIREMLNEMARVMQSSLILIAEVMENCRREFESLPELARGTVQQFQVTVTTMTNQLETATHPLLQTARQTQSGLAGLNSTVGGICQHLQAAGDTLVNAVDSSAAKIAEASEGFNSQQSRLLHAQHDLIRQAANASLHVQQFSQSLQEQGVEPLLTELNRLPGRIGADLHSIITDTVKAEFKSRIQQPQRSQAAAEAARRNKQSKAGSHNGVNGAAPSADTPPVPDRSLPQEPPADTNKNFLENFYKLFRKDSHEGNN